MLNLKRCRTGILSVLIICFIAFAVLISNFKERTVMGAVLIQQKDISKLTYDENIQAEISFNGIPAAIDEESKKIYISQNMSNVAEISDLEGDLSVNLSNHRLYITESSAESFSAGNTDNSPALKLLMVANSRTYKEYDIVFTHLPVISIKGDIIGADDKGRDLFEGKLCFWDADSAETNAYRTVDTMLQWHERGGTSAMAHGKKPQKLSLKKKSGENNDVSFLGLGEDDDWILNPMNMEDLKIREKLTMDLWEEMRTSNGYGVKMSDGEYVEAVINGRYSGLYLLQRRLDKKYLDITDGILLKGPGMHVDITAENMEIVSSPLSAEDTQLFLEKNFDGRYLSHINIDNFADISIFMQLGVMCDNQDSKNICFLLNNADEDYILDMILWDTDMSYGVLWTTSFDLEYDLYLNRMMYRCEYDQLKEIYPELDIIIAQRWFEYRKDILDKDKLLAQIEKYHSTITENGAYNRDTALWGKTYGNEDNIGLFCDYLTRRIDVLDAYYKQFI